MEATVYEVEAAVEASHWWFVGRRRLFARELARAGVRRDGRVLDIGTSTGANLRLLRDLGFHDVTGVDASENALRFCRGKGLGPVQMGDACDLPFAAASFDLVLATDIIEHVDDDARALGEISRVLAPGGKALITVPAFPSLWGLQDEQAHHKRRYRLRALGLQIVASGLRPLAGYYFNYLLFVPIWAARQIIVRLGIRLESEAQVNTPLLNAILSPIFALDVATARWLRPPFGVSILFMAEGGGSGTHA
jgi:SAM-dependent methyltransferase